MTHLLSKQLSIRRMPVLADDTADKVFSRLARGVLSITVTHQLCVVGTRPPPALRATGARV